MRQTTADPITARVSILTESGDRSTFSGRWSGACLPLPQPQRHVRSGAHDADQPTRASRCIETDRHRFNGKP